MPVKCMISGEYQFRGFARKFSHRDHRESPEENLKKLCVLCGLFFLAYALLRDFPDMTARVDEASGSHTPRTIHRTVQQFHAARC